MQVLSLLFNHVVVSVFDAVNLKEFVRTLELPSKQILHSKNPLSEFYFGLLRLRFKCSRLIFCRTNLRIEKLMLTKN